MPYHFLDDVATADIAFQATGRTVEEMFSSAAEATLAVMVENLEAVSPKEKRPISLKDQTIELLLFQFLQELIYYKDAEELLLRPTKISIKDKQGFSLTAELAGERINPQKHQLNVDVKAVTFHRYKVEKTAVGWEAVVVLDI